jgi:hypothetical protein
VTLFSDLKVSDLLIRDEAWAKDSWDTIDQACLLILGVSRTPSHVNLKVWDLIRKRTYDLSYPWNVCLDKDIVLVSTS